MGTNKIFKNLWLFLLMYAQHAFAQDLHLSQYDAAPQYINPALTGVYFGESANYRFYADYRSQWKTLAGKPLTTGYMAYDMPFEKFDKKWGVGGALINDRAGAGNFNTINLLASLAYNIIKADDLHSTGVQHIIKSDDKRIPHSLTVGLQMGFIYKSYNPNSFTYESQYNPAIGTFDSGIPSGEPYDRTNVFKFDANLGVFYKNINRYNEIRPFGGFSIYHITKPNESFTSTKSKLPMRFNIMGGIEYQVNELIKVQPNLLIMYQTRATEINIGVLGYYRINNTLSDIIAGLNYRYKDALVFQVGYKQNEQHTFRISYDINTSYLSRFSRGRGGIEFSLILTGIKGEKMFRASF